MSPPGDLFDQPPGEMRWIRGKLAEYIRDHVILSPEGVVLVTSPGTESLYPRPLQSLQHSHPVVESHACSHAIVESTNDRDHILWHAKTGAHCTEEGSINGVVRFGKVDKAYIQRNSFLPRQLLQPTNHKHHIGDRKVRSETTLFLRQDPHALTVLAEVASDDLQKYLAGVRYQRDAPEVAALCPILLFVEYHDDGIFPLLRHLAPPSKYERRYRAVSGAGRDHR